MIFSVPLLVILMVASLCAAEDSGYFTTLRENAIEKVLHAGNDDDLVINL